MSEKQWMPSVCNESSGFLFRHDCFRPPTDACSRCGKPVCEDHRREVDGQVVCIGCAKRRVNRSSRQSIRGRRYHDSYDYDPYFYGGYHYHGYHDDWRRDRSYYESMQGDPNDFTDADAGSLTDVGDEDFENDMSES